MIGGILVEKDLETIKKDLDIQIINVNLFIYLLLYLFIVFFILNCVFYLFRLNKLWKWYIGL